MANEAETVLTIDAHTHFIPRQARELLGQLSGNSGGARLSALRALPDGSPMLQVEERLGQMDQLGIDVGAVSLAPLDVLDDQGLARELIAAGNDGLVDLCAAHPGRFVTLATLPMPDAAASLEEINRLAGQQAVRGVTFPSQATLHRPDQIGLEPVLARAAELGLVVVVHPSGGNTDFGTAFDDFGLGLAFHSMISGPLVMLRLIAAGVFDRVPDLEMIVPMFGGVLPFIGYRLDGRLKGTMARRPTEYLRSSIFFDTSGFPAGPTFRCVLDAVGVTQLVLGSDYPSWEMEFVLTALEEMGLSPSDRDAILGGNASRWFDPRRARSTSTLRLSGTVDAAEMQGAL